MQPENKVVSLETAKRLRDNNFPQDTEREWQVGGKLSGSSEARLLYKKRPTTYSTADSAWSYYAAPDAQEIGELFPRNLGSELFIQLRPSGWLVRVGGNEALHENEAEARAACWLWLKEKKLIE